MNGSSTTLDSLTIDIDSSAGSSSQGIEELTQKLVKLQESVRSNLKFLGKFNSTLKQIQQTSESIKNINIKTNTGKTKTKTPDLLNISDNSTNNLKEINKHLDKIKSKINSINKNPLDVTGTNNLQGIQKLGLNNNYGWNKSFTLDKSTSNSFKEIKTTSNETGDFIDKLINKVDDLGQSFGKLAPFIRTFIGLCKTAAEVGKKVGDTIAVGITLPINYLKKEMTFGLVPANQSLIKTLRQMALALIGVRGLFTATRKAVSEYMNYDDELSESLRNNWAIIGSVVAPVIERIVQLVATLATYIATLIKTFFGVDIVARANEKALKKTGSSASGTAKAVKDLNDELGNLADFDKLHVIDFPKDTSSSGGSGSSGSGVTPLKLADVDTSWIEKLKKYIDVDDYFKLGVDIATKLEEGLDSIPWDSIQAKLLRYTDNIVDLLNGFTAKIDGRKIGSTIGNAFNTVIDVLDEFFSKYHFDWLGRDIHDAIEGAITTIDWQQLGHYLGKKIMAIVSIAYEVFDPKLWLKMGQSIGTTIMSWFETIDWEKAGRTVGNAVASIHRLVQGMFENLDGKKLAEDFNKFIKGVDWAEVGSSIHDSFIAIFNTLGDFLDNVDKDQLEEAITTFLENLKWDEISSKMFSVAWKAIKLAFSIWWSFQKQRIKERFSGIGNTIIGWFKEGILKNSPISTIATVVSNIIKGFKERLGIGEGDGSSVSESWGKKLITGIGNGIKNNPITSRISDAITRVKDTFKEKLGIKNNGDSTESESWGKKIINGFVKGLQENPLIKKFNEIKSKLTGKADEAGKEAGSAFGNKLKEVFNKIIGHIENVLNRSIRAVNGLINVVKKIPGMSNINGMSEISLPRLATGTNEIEVEGIYHLHKGEAVVPKKYNPAVNNRLYDEKNEQLINEVELLRKDIKSLQFTNVVKIGEDDIYKKQTSYNQRKQNIYGTSYS